MTATAEAVTTLPPPPTPTQVLLLQALVGYPSISLLMTTEPAPVMRPEDHGRLLAMVKSARDRLADEGIVDLQSRLVERLEELVDGASREPTGHAVAIYVNTATAERLSLPVPVEDRVVIDPTFATRDLVRAMHRTPRHVVLVLTSRDAKLYDGIGGELRPAVGSGFPMKASEGPRGTDPDRPQLKDAELATFVRRVDRALGTYLRLRPAPLVLVGPDRVVHSFTEHSRNLQRLAGTMTVNLSTASLRVLAERIRPVLEDYLRGREAEAVELLERRRNADRVVGGVPACWLAARRERPEMLAVEEGLFFPARISDDGDYLIAADDVEHPEVIDDAVDELIELVLDRGGWVALVADGTLAEHDRIALTLRRP